MYQSKSLESVVKTVLGSQTVFCLRNKLWAQARFSKSSADWTAFRNECTLMIRRSKIEFYLKSITENLNNPLKFWKSVKLLSAAHVTSNPPNQILVGSNEIKVTIISLINTSVRLDSYLTK